MPVAPTDASIPFSGTVADSLELMKNVWGMSSGLNMPTGLPQGLSAMMTPTLNVEEIDKRVADLRAVEQWLHLNLNWLRATIQSLEVQRNTIATLQSFSGALAASAQMPPSEGQAEASLGEQPAEAAQAPDLSAMQALPMHAAAWWQSLQDQFIKVATAASQGVGQAAEPSESKAPKPSKPKAKKTHTRRRSAKRTSS